MMSLLVLAGCRYAGGGIAPSKVAGQHVQFSFNLDCPAKGPASGVLTFLDHAAGVAIRATPTSCSPWSPSFSGTYVTLPPGTGTGTFTFTVTPSTPRSSTRGTYTISLTGSGIPGGSYNNGGTVDGNVVKIG